MKNDLDRNHTLPETENAGLPAGLKPSPLLLADLILCGSAIILGLLYLYTTWIPLYILLPVYIVIFSAIPVLRIADQKKKDKKGLGAWIPVIGWIIMDIIVIVATVVYFSGR